MPYSSNADLSPKVKGLIPSDQGQTIFRSAFNSILERTKSEARAFAQAYGALTNAGYKRGKDGKYVKIEKADKCPFEKADCPYNVQSQCTVSKCPAFEKSLVSKCPHMNGDLHHGVMIAFKLDEGLAKALVLGYDSFPSSGPSPERASLDEMHITLCYFGKFEDVPLSELAAAEAVLDKISASQGPIRAAVGGVGRFPATESSDFKDVVYVPVVSAELLKFREELVAALTAAGVNYSKTFEQYAPHITLAHIDQTSFLPQPRVQRAETELSEIVFLIGPIGKEFYLESMDDELPVAKGLKDAPNYRQAEDRMMQTCTSCIHGGDGYCDLYSFSYNKGYVCDSWEPMEKRYEKHVPPQAVQAKAKKALEVYQAKSEDQKGLSNGMHALCQKLANGTAVDSNEIASMVKFFQGMSKGDGETWADKGPDYQNWFGMGGNAGRSWSLKVQRKALSKVSIHVPIIKVNDEKMQVFGWVSTVEKDGVIVTDLQGAQISEDELEKAAYRFTKNVRAAGEMHRKIVGELIESMVFTKAKQAALGIDLGRVGWWAGVQVSDKGTWAQVKKGGLKEFSIHGLGVRTPIDDEEPAAA